MGDGNDVMSNNVWVQAWRPLFEGVAFVISYEDSRGVHCFPFAAYVYLVFDVHIRKIEHGESVVSSRCLPAVKFERITEGYTIIINDGQ